MGSTSKKVKLFKQFESGSDILSSLPCDVKSLILSFLPTKEAVCTSILSTKWKHTWHFITKLDLNDDDSSSTPKFISLVYDMLLQRKGSHLSVFCLSCVKRYNPFYVNSWIDAALRCNIQQLHILITLKNLSSLSRELFSSTTLAVLKLNVSFVMDVPVSVSLPCLKVVDLSYVHFLDDDSLTRFICGCPVLEELTLSECIGNDVNTINVVSPLLTRLVLEDLPLDGTDYFESKIKCKIVIDTPSLKYLEMKNYFAGGYVIKDVPNLIEAHVSCQTIHISPSDYVAIGAILQGVFNVQSLHLSWFDMMDYWSEYRFGLPKFPKLIYLKVMVDVACGILTEFVENSPCLETLIYEEEVNYQMDVDRQSTPWFFHCNSVSKNLKIIEIKFMDRTSYVCEMILFFLHKAKALRKLIVQTQCMEEVDNVLAKVKYFRKNGVEEADKLTMEYDKVTSFRRWVLDYTS